MNFLAIVFVLARVGASVVYHHQIPFRIDANQQLFVDALSTEGQPISVKLHLMHLSTGARGSTSRGFWLPRMDQAGRFLFTDESDRFLRTDEYGIGIGHLSSLLTQYQSATIIKRTADRGYLYMNATRDVFVNSCVNGTIITAEAAAQESPSIFGTFFHARIYSSTFRVKICDARRRTVLITPPAVYDFVDSQIRAQGCYNRGSDDREFVYCSNSSEFRSHLPDIHFQFVGSGTLVITAHDYLVHSATAGTWYLKLVRGETTVQQYSVNPLELAFTNLRISHNRIEICESVY